MSTVEAIQAQLGDFGVVLYPGTPDNPPKRIDDNKIQQMELRILPKANPNGKVFIYKRHEPGMCWYLQTETQ